MRQTDKSLQSEKFKQVVGGLGKPLRKRPAPDRIRSPRDLDRSFPCWPGSEYVGTAPGGVLSTAEGPPPFSIVRPPTATRGTRRAKRRMRAPLTPPPRIPSPPHESPVATLPPVLAVLVVLPGRVSMYVRWKEDVWGKGTNELSRGVGLCRQFLRASWRWLTCVLSWCVGNPYYPCCRLAPAVPFARFIDFAPVGSICFLSLSPLVPLLPILTKSPLLPLHFHAPPLASTAQLPRLPIRHRQLWGEGADADTQGGVLHEFISLCSIFYVLQGAVWGGWWREGEGGEKS